MSFSTLILIAFGTTFSLVWLIHYSPILAKKPSLFWMRKHPTTGKYCLLPRVAYVPYSPRLFICKLLAPFDIGVSIFLVLASILGITIVTGISMLVYNILTAIGISIGVLFIHKILRPRWEKQYENELADYNNNLPVNSSTSTAA